VRYVTEPVESLPLIKTVKYQNTNAKGDGR
jgi:hypothetical protein